MSDDTPNGGSELNAGSKEAAPTTPAAPIAGDDPATPEQEETPATEESSSDEELLAEITAEETPPPTAPDPAKVEAEKAERRKEAKADFKLKLTNFVAQVTEARADGKSLDDALEGIPDSFKGKIRKIATNQATISEEVENEGGSEAPKTLGAKPEMTPMQAAEAVADKKEANGLMLEIVKASGLNKKTAHAISGRKKFKADVEQFAKAMPRSKAVEAAAATNGLLDKVALAKAKKQVTRERGTALAPAGNPPISPDKHQYTAAELSQLPKPVYNKVMAKVDKGEVKIVSPKTTPVA